MSPKIHPEMSLRSVSTDTMSRCKEYRLQVSVATYVAKWWCVGECVHMYTCSHRIVTLNITLLYHHVGVTCESCDCCMQPLLVHTTQFCMHILTKLPHVPPPPPAHLRCPVSSCAHCYMLLLVLLWLTAQRGLVH